MIRASTLAAFHVSATSRAITRQRAVRRAKMPRASRSHEERHFRLLPPNSMRDYALFLRRAPRALGKMPQQDAATTAAAREDVLAPRAAWRMTRRHLLRAAQRRRRFTQHERCSIMIRHDTRALPRGQPASKHHSFNVSWCSATFQPDWPTTAPTESHRGFVAILRDRSGRPRKGAMTSAPGPTILTFIIRAHVSSPHADALHFSFLRRHGRLRSPL